MTARGSLSREIMHFLWEEVGSKLREYKRKLGFFL